MKMYLLHKELVKRSWGVNSGVRLEIIIMEKSVLQVGNK